MEGGVEGRPSGPRGRIFRLNATSVYSESLFRLEHVTSGRSILSDKKVGLFTIIFKTHILFKNSFPMLWPRDIDADVRGSIYIRLLGRPYA